MDLKRLSTTITPKVYKRLFFNHCYICNANSQNTICTYCVTGLTKNAHHCRLCKLPYNQDTTDNHLCGRCQSNQPPYNNCLAPFLFQGTIKSLIHSVKFHQGNHYIRPLMQLVCDNLIEEYNQKEWPEQLLYIPSHPKRIKERGFCQTKAMTKQLVKNLNEQIGDLTPSLPINNPITKQLHTQAQHTLSRKERLKQPTNIYQVEGEIKKHVALFDDVMTTGSTIEHCTKKLLKAGAEKVDVWVIARTPDKDR